MDHVEARALIADLALEPRRVTDLERDPSPASLALLAHVKGCAACRSELDGWRRTHEAVLQAAGSEGMRHLANAADDGPPGLPAELRTAVTEIPSRSPRLLGADGEGRVAPTASSGRRIAWQLPALAAVIVIGLVIGVGAMAVDQARQANVARDQAGELAALTTSVERVLREPGHTSIPLIGLDGGPAGIAAWSADEIVVMSAALTPPGSGAEYRCWVEQEGQRTPIGVMRFADGNAYWSGPLARYGDLALDAGGGLGVSLEVPGQGGGGVPVLIGELPS